MRIFGVAGQNVFSLQVEFLSNLGTPALLEISLRNISCGENFRVVGKAEVLVLVNSAVFSLESDTLIEEEGIELVDIKCMNVVR